MDHPLRESIERAVHALKRAGAREVYLFGSTATGACRPGSDIDLAVSGLPPENFFAALGEAADLLPCSLDLVDLDESNPFTRYLKEEGEMHRVG